MKERNGIDHSDAIRTLIAADKNPDIVCLSRYNLTLHYGEVEKCSLNYQNIEINANIDKYSGEKI